MLLSLDFNWEELIKKYPNAGRAILEWLIENNRILKSKYTLPLQGIYPSLLTYVVDTSEIKGNEVKLFPFFDDLFFITNVTQIGLSEFTYYVSNEYETRKGSLYKSRREATKACLLAGLDLYETRLAKSEERIKLINKTKKS